MGNANSSLKRYFENDGSEPFGDRRSIFTVDSLSFFPVSVWDQINATGFDSCLVHLNIPLPGVRVVGQLQREFHQFDAIVLHLQQP